MHDASFPAADFDDPAGQTVQAPANVLAVAPAFANLPTGHVFAVRVKQAPPLPVEYVPERQLVQSSAASLPAGDDVPAAQVDVHDAAFPAAALYDPAGQTVQAPVSESAVAPALANLPTAHVVTDSVEQAADSLICPVVVPYLPAAHNVQDD